MRNAVVLGAACSVAAALVVGLGPSAAGTPGGASAALNPAARATVVAYRGVRVPVPAGWSVHRLDREPTRCVRYDVNAVYVGRSSSSAEPDCPARVIGGATALHVEPLDTAAERRRTPVRPDRLAHYAVRATPEHRTQVVLPEAGVTLSGVYGTDPASLQDAIRRTRLTPSWQPSPSPTTAPHGTPTAASSGKPAVTSSQKPVARPGVASGGKPAGAGGGGVQGGGAVKAVGEPVRESARPHWVRGRAFDTCAAPGLATMRAWRSAYRIANIYIGGVSRGCAQPHLTRGWVRNVRALGYRLIPTYVGPQAPCTRYRARFTRHDARAEGARAAADAVRRARALGIPAGSPIYADLEDYDSGNASCRAAALDFVESWTRALRTRHYVAGLYSSAASGIRDLGRAPRSRAKPPVVWFGHWDGRPSVYDSRYLNPAWWPPHRRIKQYRGSHRERHGGVALRVDSNAVDGRVY
ncbi:glycoside hydrolase domain-containing protein [Actinomadura rayongensis]|uniref:DUF1906 domain-containing protein n=1 Tax=Actinomadura rayongensis TaxID=1429076 RepID=A0A6I4W2R7_9ACTN|nr:glycoside hydrolase domain-containing protein [Actinomadura rayongensis]MXQ63741.1 DUF1906 domain-containing protein [Actinomadura rayongensis]